MNEALSDRPPDGNAVVYCEGAFDTTYGKTAHGLVRFTRRYRVLSVVDRHLAGRDAGAVLDGRPNRIPIVARVADAVAAHRDGATPATHLVIGLAPDGGRLDAAARAEVLAAIDLGLNVDSGLHSFLCDDADIAARAAAKEIVLRDVRRPPDRSRLHFFEGKIEQVDSLKVAILGTDSAVGKRTTAWRVVDGFAARGIPAELVGTGQTAWLQGARFSVVMDALVNDFVSGEIEHAVWSAWNARHPAVIVIEGQGSLMNPAYPGGFEILAAGRPDVVVLQHAPARKDYDGFPGYPIQPLPKQIQAVELIGGRPVVAVTVNHENLTSQATAAACRAITAETGLVAVDVLAQGPEALIDALLPHLTGRRAGRPP